jgi:hypothetical protein
MSADLFSSFSDSQPPPNFGPYRTVPRIKVESIAINNRDAAIEQVTENAEKSCPGFGDRARAFVLDYLAKHGDTSSEVLTAKAIAAGIEPHNSKAFGGIYQSLSRRGLIKKAGHCQRVKGNMTSVGVVWDHFPCAFAVIVCPVPGLQITCYVQWHREPEQTIQPGEATW